MAYVRKRSGAMKPARRRDWICDWLKTSQRYGHMKLEANIANYPFVNAYLDATGAADSCLSVDLRALHAEGRLNREARISGLAELGGPRWVRSYFLPVSPNSKQDLAIAKGDSNEQASA